MFEFCLWQWGNVVQSTTTESWTHNFAFLVLSINTTDHFTPTLTTISWKIKFSPHTHFKFFLFSLPSWKEYKTWQKETVTRLKYWTQIQCWKSKFEIKGVLMHVGHYFHVILWSIQSAKWTGLCRRILYLFSRLVYRGFFSSHTR